MKTVSRVCWTAGCVLVVTALAVGLLIAAAASAGAQTTGSEAVSYRWQNKEIVGLGGRCLEVRQAAPGGVVRMADCGGAGQRWSLRSDGLLALAARPDLCLDLREGKDARGTPVMLFPCHGGASQVWRAEGGRFLSAGGHCLEVKGGHEVRGALVQIGACGNGRHQQWTAR
jgi:hypothetical protein